MRKAEIKMHGELAGWLREDEDGYHFQYAPSYLQMKDPKPVSLKLRLQGKEFEIKGMFSFFDGLFPEGWLLDTAEKNWKLNTRDRMGLLLVCCKDCIGAVSVHPLNENDA